MKIVPTRRSDYGIRALVYLAEHEGEHSKAAEIAAAMQIPQGFLHQVLQELQRAALVTSRPSRTGGYALARPAAAISVLDAIEALEGPVEGTECAMRGGPCHWDDVCALHGVWSSARQALADRLASSTIGEVAAADLALAAGSAAAPPDSHRARPSSPRPTRSAGNTPDV
ncbi:MAG: Rrf2 family transcriptional regulator [Acidimicrobiia bacterium]